MVADSDNASDPDVPPKSRSELEPPSPHLEKRQVYSRLEAAFPPIPSSNSVPEASADGLLQLVLRANHEEPANLRPRVSPRDEAFESEQVTLVVASRAISTESDRERRRHAYNSAPTEKLTVSEVFLSVRGVENLFIYAWIMKDLSWTQCWYYPSWVFGILALGLSLFALGRGVRHGHHAEELWFGFGQFVWLFANFAWMVHVPWTWTVCDAGVGGAP